MHIEPGIVHGAKMALGLLTASGAALYSLKLASQSLKREGLVSLGARSAMATLGVVIFFEILPHFSAGVSEVHFIFGTTLLLMLGVAPAAFGLMLGLLVQGLLVSPTDLPMYLINLTTLLVPLFAIHVVAKRVISPNTAYVDLRYGEALKLSATYQGGVVAWVAFWVVWGQGVGVDTLAAVGAFAAAYSVVLLVEPLADLAILAGAKRWRNIADSGLFTPRLCRAQA